MADGLQIEPLVFHQVGNPQSPGGTMGQQRLHNTAHDIVSMLPPPDLRHLSGLEAPALLDSRVVGNKANSHHPTTTNNKIVDNNNNKSNDDTANLDAIKRDLTGVSPTAPAPAGPEVQRHQLQNQYFAQQIDGLQHMLALQHQQLQHQQQQQHIQQQQAVNGGGQGTGTSNGNGGSPVVNPSSGAGAGANIGGGSGLNRNASGPSSPLLPLIGTSIENPLLSVLVDKSTTGSGTTTAPQINNNNINNNNFTSYNGMGDNRHPPYQQYHVQHLQSHPNPQTQLLQQQQQGSPGVPNLMQGDTPTASPAQIQGGLGPTPNTAAANVLSTMQHYAQQPGGGGGGSSMNISGMDPRSLMRMDGGDGFGNSPQAPATAPRRRRGRGGGNSQPVIPRAPRPRPEGAVAPPRSSQYRGVTKHRRSGRYEAHIWVKDLGRQVYLGGYECEEHAAEAYDIAALKSKGSRTKINFELSKYTDLLGCIDRMTMEELVMAVRRQSQGFSRGTSTYRGVTHHPSGRWEARIGIPGSKHVYLGLYMEEREAAQAYDRALVRLRGGTAATNFSLAEYRLEMGDYHRMQSRLLRNDPLFTDISANAVLYERWIKNGTEGFPEVESPEMEAEMDKIAAVLTDGDGNAVGAGGNNAAAAGAGAVVALAAGAGAADHRQGEEEEEEEALKQDLAMSEQPPQRQTRSHGPAMIALQAKLAGGMQPGEQQDQQQQQQTVENNDAMQQT